jgi:ferredoxin-NADP reductase
MPAPPTFNLRLVRSRILSPSVRELAFERTDGAVFDFQAGQWVSLVLPLAEGEGRRAYSIASPPNGTPGLAIAVTKVAGGHGSAFLHAMREGEVLRAIGPQGFFTRPRGGDERQPALLIGTGTGVTPLRSILLDALAHGDDSPMTLLFGVRHPEDRLYQEELATLADRHPNFRLEVTLSRASDTWIGRNGYVQTHVPELWEDLAARGGGRAAHAYICGLERMVGAVRAILRKDLGADRRQIHTERYD